MSLSRDDLREDLRTRVFGSDGQSYTNRRLGLEVECIPVDRRSRAVVLPDGPDGGTGGLFEELAKELGWKALDAPAGGGRWSLPDSGVFTFEPGGQIEYSSTVHEGLGSLRAEMEEGLRPLRAAALERGMELLHVGIDPVNASESARLVLHSERYERMARHFDAFGQAGRRMMRQTAAIHLNLEFGPEPFGRWRAANRLAPYMIGIFANSSVHEGVVTGHRSLRSAQWRKLDPARTGVVGGDDPIRAYLEFALGAPVLFLGEPTESRRPLREWLEEDRVDLGVWRRHLSTLFPEVRPRGYLEFRGVDALPFHYALVPAVLACGVLYDDRALREVLRLFPDPEPADLVAAGRVGVTEPNFRARAETLWDVALGGAERLIDFVSSEELAAAREFRARYTARGLDPASEQGGGVDARAG